MQIDIYCNPKKEVPTFMLSSRLPLAYLHALMLTSIIHAIVYLITQDLPLFSSNMVIASGTFFLIHTFYKKEKQENEKNENK